VAIHIQRREFISTLVGGAAAASPIVACADSGKVARIGYLSPDSPSPAATALFDAFCDGLRELGWIKGKNVIVELRYAENRVERLPEVAAELVRINVDVIVGRGTLGPLAAKRATSTIPIVMAASGDPLGSGLVASLARPGGNVTGMSLMVPDLGGKRLELLKELLPRLARDFDGVFEVARKQRPDALITVEDPLTFNYQKRIADFALVNQLPSLHGVKEFVVAGGLLSYGANVADLYRRAASYVDKILKGAKPADLPVQQPTKFELVINLQTAKTLGLTVPPMLLARADEVIE
jgi:putative ABC transport system substrate-binding protein